MNTAMEVLVIIVSATLTLFLILFIIVLIYILKLVRSIKRITDKAEALADKAGVVGDFFGRAAGPAAIGRLMTHLANNVFKQGKKGKQETEDDE